MDAAPQGCAVILLLTNASCALRSVCFFRLAVIALADFCPILILLVSSIVPSVLPSVTPVLHLVEAVMSMEQKLLLVST